MLNKWLIPALHLFSYFSQQSLHIYVKSCVPQLYPVEWELSDEQICLRFCATFPCCMLKSSHHDNCRWWYVTVSLVESNRYIGMGRISVWVHSVLVSNIGWCGKDLAYGIWRYPTRSLHLDYIGSRLLLFQECPMFRNGIPTDLTSVGHGSMLWLPCG